jgi:YD repeat-containing protein
VLSEKVYNQASSLVRETLNSYNTFQVWSHPGAVGASAVESTIVYYLVNGIIHFQPYRKIQSGEHKLNLMQQLVSTTTTEYLNGNQISTTTNNFYENTEHFLITRSETTDSKGNLYTTKFFYPKDLPAVPFMNDLVAENQVTSPIIMERYQGSAANPYATLIEKVQTFYSNTNSITGDVLPKEVFTYNLGDATGQQRVLYEKYSNNGRTLLQYRKSNENIPVALLWGHNRLLPIAQVMNATSDQVAFTSFEENSTDGGWENLGTTTSSTSKTGTNCSDAGNTISKSGLPTGDYVVGFWAKLISGSGTVTINGTPLNITATNWKYYEVIKNGATSVSVSNSNVYIDELRLHPVGAQMTSYTYRPLVGMTSQTDANGIVTYFEYDSFGRLQVVKDSDGNIVKANAYHYKQ